MLGRGGRRNLGGGGSGGGTFLEVLLNLSDLNNVATARTNLGFVAQTSGRVLLGDGSTTFTSDAKLTFVAASNQLLLSTLTTSEFPLLTMQAARSTTADLVSGDTVGKLSFSARANSAYSDVALIHSEYTGDGTEQTGELVFSTANNAAPTERLRITAAGVIDTTLSAGVAYFNASGHLLSETSVTLTELQYLDATSSIQTQIDSKQASGNYITALTGEVTASGPGSVAATIALNAVTNAKMAQMATLTIKGNNTGGASDPLDLSVAQVTAMLNEMTGGGGTGLKGLVPAQAGGDVTKFLRGDATWVDLPGSRQKAGKVDLAQGATTHAISFAAARSDELYTPHFFLLNSTDDDPIGIPVRFIAISDSGFTAEWDDPLPTGDYDGYWSIQEHYDPA